MTRQIVRLDSNNTQQSINLEFDAEVLSVINPTAQSIGVSVGGNIPPQTVQSADIWIPADSGINYPVVGRNFAAAFMPPLLVNAPTGIPTAANLFFTAQEPVPNFGAFPLSTLATQSLADVVLLPQTIVGTWSGPPAIPPQWVLSLTPDIRAVSVLFNASIAGASISGQVTYASYVNTEIASDSRRRISANISAMDATVTIQAWSIAGGGGNISVVGHRETIVGETTYSGALAVAVVGSKPVAANPSWGAAPTYSAYQQQPNPAVNQDIATISGIPDGIYRIEWEIACETPTPAVNKKAYLVDTTNGLVLAAVPFPGSRGGVISAYGPGNAFSLAVQNGTAITDGSYLLGAIRVWKL